MCASLITSLDKVQQNDQNDNRGGASISMGWGENPIFYILGPFSPKQGGEQGRVTALGWEFPPVSHPQTPI